MSNPRPGMIRDYSRFTPREREVLRLFCLGLGEKDLADRLGISVTRVTQIKQTLYHKLNVPENKIAWLIRRAILRGLFRIEEWLCDECPEACKGKADCHVWTERKS